VRGEVVRPERVGGAPGVKRVGGGAVVPTPLGERARRGGGPRRGLLRLSRAGLGLAQVYGIVKQSDGWIHVESPPGEGAIFRIFLPIQSATAVKAPVRELLME
jgi:hypothetical protein